MARILTILALFLLATNTSSVSAKSVLTVSDDFNVISINGKSYSTTLLQKKKEVKLKQGQNKIALQFEVVYDSEEDDSFDIIKSEIFIMSFYAKRNEQYRINYLKPFNPRAANKFIRRPNLLVLDRHGKSIKTQLGFPRSQSTAFIHQSTRQKLVPKTSILISSKKEKLGNSLNRNQAVTSENAYKKLLFWWEKATLNERKAFLKKINL